MPSEGTKACANCIYWQSYPLTNDFGSCQHTSSRYFQRGVSSSTEGCEHFALQTSKSRRCEDCHDWFPLDTMPHIGECHSSSSPFNLKPIFWDKASGDCFKERTLEGEEFLWCETCRETIPGAARGEHKSHNLFIGSSHIPVDEMVEATLAGD